MSKSEKAILRFARYLLVWALLVVGLGSCFKPPLCTVPGCHVRYKHPHQGVVFRGQPWYKLNQNPKTGQGYTTIRENTKKRKLMKEDGRKNKNAPTINGRGQGPESSGSSGGNPSGSGAENNPK